MSPFSDKVVAMFSAVLLSSWYRLREWWAREARAGSHSIITSQYKTKLYLFQSLTPVNPQIQPDRAVQRWPAKSMRRCRNRVERFGWTFPCLPTRRCAPPPCWKVYTNSRCPILERVVRLTRFSIMIQSNRFSGSFTENMLQGINWSNMIRIWP